MILRKLATEKPDKFLEIAYGKVPQPIDVTTGGEKLTWKDFVNADPGASGE
jgi:hypothetical protein